MKTAIVATLLIAVCLAPAASAQKIRLKNTGVIRCEYAVDSLAFHRILPHDRDLANLMKDNTNASDHLRRYRSLNEAGHIVVFLGIVTTGVASLVLEKDELKFYPGSTEYTVHEKSPDFTTAFLIGGGVCAVGLGLKIASRSQLSTAVRIYNDGLEESNGSMSYRDAPHALTSGLNLTYQF